MLLAIAIVFAFAVIVAAVVVKNGDVEVARTNGEYAMKVVGVHERMAAAAQAASAKMHAAGLEAAKANS